MNPNVLLNGKPAPDAWARSRGLHYGDGVFRTCLIHGGAVVALPRQLEKLAADAARLQLRVAQPEMLREECERLARVQDRGVLKILLVRSGFDRSYRSTSELADRLVCCYPPVEHETDIWQRGIRVVRSAFQLAPQPRLAGIKHLNRLEQVLASRDCGAAQEAILGDDGGRPLGGTRSNLFWVTDGVLRTPALDRCGVAGLTRDLVLEQAAVLGIVARVEAGSWDELAASQEVFVTSSIVGVCPVRALDSQVRPAPGPVTRRLMSALQHPGAP
jgi:4-amino-4-deoxychorismate lyase